MEFHPVVTDQESVRGVNTLSMRREKLEPAPCRGTGQSGPVACEEAISGVRKDDTNA